MTTAMHPLLAEIDPAVLKRQVQDMRKVGRAAWNMDAAEVRRAAPGILEKLRQKFAGARSRFPGVAVMCGVPDESGRMHIFRHEPAGALSLLKEPILRFLEMSPVNLPPLSPAQVRAAAGSIARVLARQILAELRGVTR